MRKKAACKHCGKFKEIVKGLCGRCYEKKYRLENPERRKVIKRKYYQKNFKKVKEANKKYRLENLEKARVAHKKWYLENSERMKAVRRKYYQENSKKVKETCRKWQLENPGKVREISLKRRGYGEVKRGVVDRVINANIFKYGAITCEKDKKPCLDNFHIDHIIPVSKGGSNNFDNLQILCADCNFSKHTDIADYRGTIIEPQGTLFT